MTRYVALLRGINVGGNNIIKMAALAEAFSDHGFTDVKTYIASGNVLFTAAKATPKAKLVKELEALLSKRFGYSASVVVRSHKELKATVARAPKGFGSQPAKYRYDVLFLKDPLKATSAIKDLPLKEGVDAVAAGPGALYFSRLIAKATSSQLARVVMLPIYKQMTIRNWNTTSALLRLMEEHA